jgi:hypothetical protein
MPWLEAATSSWCGSTSSSSSMEGTGGPRGIAAACACRCRGFVRSSEGIRGVNAGEAGQCSFWHFLFLQQPLVCGYDEQSHIPVGGNFAALSQQQRGGNNEQRGGGGGNNEQCSRPHAHIVCVGLTRGPQGRSPWSMQLNKLWLKSGAPILQPVQVSVPLVVLPMFLSVSQRHCTNNCPSHVYGD